MSYPTFLMSQLLLDSTTLFDECAYDEMWDASCIHYNVFEHSEWCKGEQTEYMDGDCKLHQQRPQRGIKTLVKSNNAEEDIT